MLLAKYTRQKIKGTFVFVFEIVFNFFFFFCVLVCFYDIKNETDFTSWKKKERG